MWYNASMYLKRCRPTKSKNEHVYWELVESYHTERRPRQWVVAYLGNVGERERLSVEYTATKRAISAVFEKCH